jgi:hypothetical protein
VSVGNPDLVCDAETRGLDCADRPRTGGCAAPGNQNWMAVKIAEVVSVGGNRVHGI